MSAGTPAEGAAPAGAGRRIAGLDSLRGVLALAVFFSHDTLPPVMLGYDESSAVLRKVNALVNWSINGQFAVLAFFLISGFCIHYPYVFRPPETAAFYTNRALRLSLPALVALALTWVAGLRPPFQLNGVPIWSLWCELTYYLVYPLLLPWMRGPRWKGLLAVTYLGAGAALVATGRFNPYAQSGYVCTTVMGLPVWLLGAFLADQTARRTVRAAEDGSAAVWPGRVWVVRAAVLAASDLTLTLSYSKTVGLGWTLTLVSPLLYVWVREEIARYEARPEPGWSKGIGQFSYSLYLLHLLGVYLLARVPLWRLGGNLSWVIRVVGVVAGSYVFYRVVELPAHRFSRWAGRRMEGRRKAEA